MRREYLETRLHIDGRNIPYPVFNASMYLEEHDRMSEEAIEEFCETKPELYTRLNQIIALKQSCFLLRHTGYSCESLSDDLFNLKMELIKEIKMYFGYEFDDAWMESLIP